MIFCKSFLHSLLFQNIPFPMNISLPIAPTFPINSPHPLFFCMTNSSDWLWRELCLLQSHMISQCNFVSICGWNWHYLSWYTELYTLQMAIVTAFHRHRYGRLWNITAEFSKCPGAICTDMDMEGSWTLLLSSPSVQVEFVLTWIWKAMEHYCRVLQVSRWNLYWHGYGRLWNITAEFSKCPGGICTDIDMEGYGTLLPSSPSVQVEFVLTWIWKAMERYCRVLQVSRWNLYWHGYGRLWNITAEFYKCPGGICENARWSHWLEIAKERWNN